MEEGRDRGEVGNVVGETPERGGREETVVGKTGLIEGSMAVHLHREPDAGGREELNVPSTDCDTEAKSWVVKHPPRNTKYRPSLSARNPDRKLLAEIPVASNGAFVGQTSQMQAFVHQVNATSCCSTLGCTGLLKPTCVNLTGLGGAVNTNYDCTSCLERWLTFSSSALCEVSGQIASRMLSRLPMIPG